MKTVNQQLFSVVHLLDNKSMSTMANGNYIRKDGIWSWARNNFDNEIVRKMFEFTYESFIYKFPALTKDKIINDIL